MLLTQISIISSNVFVLTLCVCVTVTLTPKKAHGQIDNLNSSLIFIETLWMFLKIPAKIIDINNFIVLFHKMPDLVEEKGPEATIFLSDELPMLLPVYYKRLFPHKLFYRWLSYGLCKSGLCIYNLKTQLTSIYLNSSGTLYIQP